jgi:hypothetical protein
MTAWRQASDRQLCPHAWPGSPVLDASELAGRFRHIYLRAGGSKAQGAALDPLSYPSNAWLHRSRERLRVEWRLLGCRRAVSSVPRQLGQTDRRDDPPHEDCAGGGDHDTRIVTIRLVVEPARGETKANRPPRQVGQAKHSRRQTLRLHRTRPPLPADATLIGLPEDKVEDEERFWPPKTPALSQRLCGPHASDRADHTPSLPGSSTAPQHPKLRPR